LNKSNERDTAVTESRKTMARLLELPACTMVTTGRTGTDFLQSLLDSHPEVLTFNGSIFFQDFWNNSVCVAAGEFDPRDLIDEFIGKFIERFKSRYDLLEGKDQLGEESDQTLNIDLDRFRAETAAFLEGQEATSKTVLMAIYAAYAVCMGQDLGKKKLFFHHIHHFDQLPHFLGDFPESKIICMTRDPRANFVSGVEHHRNNNFLVGDTDRGSHVYFYIKRILEDAAPLQKYSGRYMSVRLEDLGEPEIIEELCHWLGINNHETTANSTWGGLAWQGDRISTQRTGGKFSSAVLVNRWEKRLSFTDKIVLNYIMNNRLKHYAYKHRRITPIDTLLVPLLILLPLRYELRFASFGYLKKALRRREAKKLVQNLFAYVNRVSLFFKFYAKVTMMQKFSHPFLAVPAPNSSSSQDGPKGQEVRQLTPSVDKHSVPSTSGPVDVND
jgi:hypothetical protein